MRSLVLVLLVACSSTKAHTIKMTNRTPRMIEQIFVYPVGAKSPGASRGKLAPNATTAIDVKEGNVEVRAVAAEEQLENNQRERKEATQILELRSPTELVFHDSTQSAPPGSIGVVFRVMPAP